MTTVFWHLQKKLAAILTNFTCRFSSAPRNATTDRDAEAQSPSRLIGDIATSPVTLTMRVLEVARKAPVTNKAFEWLFNHMDDDSDWEKFLEGLVPLVKSNAAPSQETVQESTLKYVTSNAQLVTKIWHLLGTCGNSGGLSEHTRIRRSTTCLRVMWHLLHSHSAEDEKAVEVLRPKHLEEETTRVLKDIRDQVEDPMLSIAAHCMEALAQAWKQDVNRRNQTALHTPVSPTSPTSSTGVEHQDNNTKLSIVTDLLSPIVSPRTPSKLFDWPTHARVVNRTLTLLTTNFENWSDPSEKEREEFLEMWDVLQRSSEKSSLSSPLSLGDGQGLSTVTKCCAHPFGPALEAIDSVDRVLRPLHTRIMTQKPPLQSPASGSALVVAEPSPSHARPPAPLGSNGTIRTDALRV
ncbi:hypothetical protein OF83DRAFT_183619 [Amylostereum chailletii]|nr:hypothetical protein OF83DRAFT_183619 [Amylostereum chailletii]